MSKFMITDTPEEVALKIGSRISALRLSRNLSQMDLAERAGISKRSLERLENAKGNPRFDAFVAVCSALGLTERFDALLPEVTLSPKDVFEGCTLRKRARTVVKKRIKWGDEQ